MDEKRAINNILKVSAFLVFEETLVQALCECDVDEEMIVEQLCKHCERTPEKARTLISLEKKVRAPIRALQKYLEDELFFSPDIQEAVYELMAPELLKKRELQKASPEQLYSIFWPELQLLKDGISSFDANR